MITTRKRRWESKAEEYWRKGYSQPAQAEDPINALLLAVTEAGLPGFFEDPLEEVARRTDLSSEIVAERLHLMRAAGTLSQVRQVVKRADPVSPLSPLEWRILATIWREFLPDELAPNLWASRIAELDIDRSTFFETARSLERRGMIGPFVTVLKGTRLYKVRRVRGVGRL